MDCTPSPGRAVAEAGSTAQTRSASAEHVLLGFAGILNLLLVDLVDPPLVAGPRSFGRRPCHPLMQLVDIRLTPPVLEYVVECVAETVEYTLEHRDSLLALESWFGLPPLPPRHTSPPSACPYPLSSVITRAEVTPATVLGSSTSRTHARTFALEEWAPEYVFLGALITASKYTNDSTLKNVHWSLCTLSVSSASSEFLDMLDWELGVREADVLAQHQGLPEATYGQPPHTDKKTLTSSTVVPSPLARTPAKRLSSHAELDPSLPTSSLASLSSPCTPAHSSYAASPAPAADKARKPDVPTKVAVRATGSTTSCVPYPAAPPPRAARRDTRWRLRRLHPDVFRLPSIRADASSAC
ncbi:hypothetical protein GGX14DRAFT_384537 [Mycena pura]|uniref:Cyclin N-terminal domain-containing protein n=1 Tax=Mycena pura TaxID=153505 RepID=A0AAD7E5Y4_9AGAR|nr:hypothetical protein GGX14DRAFT_384537 [Mycena pura]